MPPEYHREIQTMQAHLTIDEHLMQCAPAAPGLQTEQETVEEALRLLVRFKEQERIRAARGKLPWDGGP